LRRNALIDRKAELRRLLSQAPTTSRIRYADDIEYKGQGLFDLVCQRDLEGIVAKLKYGNYVSEREHSTWFKIKNRSYSQSEAGRVFRPGKEARNVDPRRLGFLLISLRRSGDGSVCLIFAKSSTGRHGQPMAHRVGKWLSRCAPTAG
jgi:ATP-dependent DNA ligase